MVGDLIVTDMLAAVLNICTQEELKESAEEPSLNVVTVDRDKAERRKVIKNKILAIGRLSHMFSVLRYVTVLLILIRWMHH
jgi:serine/threonine-protein phosphatase 2B catalytic subunit